MHQISKHCLKFSFQLTKVLWNALHAVGEDSVRKLTHLGCDDFNPTLRDAEDGLQTCQKITVWFPETKCSYMFIMFFCLQDCGSALIWPGYESASGCGSGSRFIFANQDADSDLKPRVCIFKCSGSITFWYFFWRKQCCGSGMFNQDRTFCHPGFRIRMFASRILDPHQRIKVF